MEDSRKIFISYSSSDRDFCKKLMHDLFTKGFQVWMDKFSIPGGKIWAKSIDEALHECTDLIAVHSPNSYNSYHAKGEWIHALDLGKRVYPIIIKDGILVHPYLNHLQAINFASSDMTYDEHFAKLIEGIQHKRSGEPDEGYSLAMTPVKFPFFFNGAGNNSAEFIIHANEIRYMGGLGHSFVVLNHQALCDRLCQGAKLKMVVADPTDANLHLLALWSSENFEHIKKLVLIMIEDLCTISQNTPPESIQLRVLDKPSPFSMIQCDPTDINNGRIILTLYPFVPGKKIDFPQSAVRRPSTVLHYDVYPRLYEHFRLSFENAWKIAAPTTVAEFSQKYGM